ncbi:homocysteine S-methyltransferase family protein [Alginatibacterium sediminis]|uniref:Homocysteine S-methyltransferase family protein n=1 Tax=Alginatibacterium sediminis TaxID=2164068 RepID=A0A420EI04_9ALTE|nr:homocysteine S-methyltransferase family protein [Alginatibacterium sediminis]RKF20342.1 homocysteine S-methyltransferase family protein [Alginatibacterium sediminis]
MPALPKLKNGQIYLCEGGPETELMYKHGVDLPEFALFSVLDKPKAMDCLLGMYRRYLDVVAKHQQCALVSGLDYRASNAWGAKIGYSTAAIKQANLASIEFLRQLQTEYSREIPDLVIQGLLGPKEDAYASNSHITALEAERYHTVQLAVHKQAGLTLVTGMTVHHVAEAIGMVRAATKLSLPIAISLRINEQGRLAGGLSLEQAITMIDAQTNRSAEFFMLNCSHPQEYQPWLESAQWIQRVRGIRPNAVALDKISLLCSNQLHAGDPQALGKQVAIFAKRFGHMDIWGGCCGTWSEHLDAIACHLID